MRPLLGMLSFYKSLEFKSFQLIMCSKICISLFLHTLVDSTGCNFDKWVAYLEIVVISFISCGTLVMVISFISIRDAMGGPNEYRLWAGKGDLFAI